MRHGLTQDGSDDGMLRMLDVRNLLARTRKHEQLGQNLVKGPFERNGILTTKLVPGDSHMYEKPSLGIPVSKFRILLKIRHILWSKNRPWRAILLPLPFSTRGPHRISAPLQHVRETTAASETRLHARVAGNRRSKLTPSWPSYLFERFSGVNG